MVMDFRREPNLVSVVIHPFEGLLVVKQAIP